MNPSDYNLPHPAWRKHQHESVLWCLDIGEDPTPPTALMEAPTGSGKSAIAVAQAVKGRTVILTHTKNLQAAYADFYNIASLMGKSNYSCRYDTKVRCDECAFKRYAECPEYGNCEYVNAKMEALRAEVVVTNYALWLSDKRFRERGAELVVLDECHLVRDISMNWSGCTVNSRDRLDWGLSAFPKISILNADTYDTARVWLGSAMHDLANVGSDLRTALESDRDNTALKKRLKQCENLYRKLSATNEAMLACPDAWFIRSGPGVCYYRRPLPGIIIRPLTAKFHFPRLFSGHKTLLMSATIGDIPTYARSLGIDEFAQRVVPNQYEPWQRPIHILDAPRMSYRNRENVVILSKQADVIADAIKSVDPSWSGIIHVTRKTEAPALAKRLAQRGVYRTWVPPLKYKGRWIGTQEQMELWIEHLKWHPDAVLVAWQFWQGYDGRDERMCFAGKTPFESLGSDYKKAKMKYDGSSYQLDAARLLQQSLGRTRRGRPQDYDTKTEKRGLVAIADGNWTRVKSRMSPDMLEAMV